MFSLLWLLPTGNKTELINKSTYYPSVVVTKISANKSSLKILMIGVILTQKVHQTQRGKRTNISL